MNIKNLDNIFPLWIIKFLLWIIYFQSLNTFGQATTDSYETLWNLIENDSISTENKINYLDIYYQKARKEQNTLKQYLALEKKTYLVSYNEATHLLNKMHPLVQKIDNDSIKGDFLNRSTVFYYDNRDFEKALYYAIESEAFNEKINNLYNLNAVRIDIGNIYYHMKYYDKAIHYFNQAKEYYKTKNDYNSIRSYVISMYCLSKSFWQIGDISKLSATIKESQEAILKLTPKDQQLENAYITYLEGGLTYLQKNDNKAKEHFTKALTGLQKNEDFTNEHIIYLYLGKIAWKQDHKDEAYQYFSKIEKLFNEKTFLNYELREAFEYLIIYYKEKGQTKSLAKATETLITLNQAFEKEQQSIINTLHEDFDQKKIKSKQQQLEKNLTHSKIWISLLGSFLVIIAGFVFLKRKTDKKNSEKDLVVNNVGEVKIIENTYTEAIEEQNIIEPVEDIIITNIHIEEKTKEWTPTELRIIEGLTKFEMKKEFLLPITLDELANQLNTSRSTLSPFLNEQKGGFNTYINSLRINQFIEDLTKNKKLRQKSLKELASSYGDLHPKSFSKLFKAVTGETPSEFIERLEKKDNL